MNALSIASKRRRHRDIHTRNYGMTIVMSVSPPYISPFCIQYNSLLYYILFTSMNFLPFFSHLLVYSFPIHLNYLELTLSGLNMRL